MVEMTAPKLEDRAEQHYAGIRVQTPHTEFSTVIPTLLDEIFAWLGSKGIKPAGPPFMRYHVIQMPGELDVELGVPVESAIEGEGRIKEGVIPAGRYGALIYTGVANGIKGNGALLNWGAEQGLTWDTYDDPNGDGFASRVEYYLTGPDEDPDPSKWDTEVAIKLAD